MVHRRPLEQRVDLSLLCLGDYFLLSPVPKGKGLKDRGPRATLKGHSSSEGVSETNVSVVLRKGCCAGGHTQAGALTDTDRSRG